MKQLYSHECTSGFIENHTDDKVFYTIKIPGAYIIEPNQGSIVLSGYDLYWKHKTSLRQSS